MIRPEIQELLDRTALVPTPQPNRLKVYRAVGIKELQDPYEWFFSHYRSDENRPFETRTELMRIEWFSPEPIPESLKRLDDCVVIIHNHASDRPCYANDGCRRVR